MQLKVCLRVPIDTYIYITNIPHVPIDLRVFLWALVMRPFDSGRAGSMAPILYMVYSWHILESRLGAHTRQALGIDAGIA